MYSIFAQDFNRHCERWTDNATENLKFLKKCQSDCNKQLYEDGFMFLSEVYEMIGLEKKPCIVGMGWWMEYGKENSNYIDFGIYDRSKKTSRNFINRLDPNIILDFNIDGNLCDYLMDEALYIGGPDMIRDFYDSRERYMDYLFNLGYEKIAYQGG